MDKMKEIELLISKKRKSLEMSHSVIIGKPLASISQSDRQRKKEIEVELTFLGNLMSRLNSLKANLEVDEYTYNELKVKYLIEHLPPQLSDRLSKALSADVRRMHTDFYKTEKARVKKEQEDLINQILNMHSENVFLVPNSTLDVKRIAKKNEVKKANKKTSENTRLEFSEIIDWISKNYVDCFSRKFSGKTYYIDRFGAKKIKNPLFISDEMYKGFVSSNNSTYTNVDSEYSMAQELLTYAKLDLKLQIKVQKIKDLASQFLHLERIKQVIKKLEFNDEYVEFNKELNKINGEIIRSIQKINAKLENLRSEVDIKSLYERKKEEIEKNKLEKEKKEKDINAAKEVNTEVKSPVEMKNDAWKKKYLDEQIKIIFLAIYHRELTQSDTSTNEYSHVKKIAEKNLSEYLSKIDKEYVEHLLQKETEELKNYISKTYGVSTQEEMDAIIAFNKMSPEERYIKEMVDSKKKPISTKKEDLTAEDLKAINKNKDYYASADIIIKNHIQQIDIISSTSFISTKGIETIISELQKIKQKQQQQESKESKI